MHQLTQEKLTMSMAETLSQLRQALADADPLATPAHDLFVEQAHALTETFENASPPERQGLLLRALDEAIAALELGARLADMLQGEPHGARGDEVGAATEDPLRATYRAFVESQPNYQELYHYRNALAERLRSSGSGADAAIAE